MNNKLLLFLVALAAGLSGASVVAAGAQEPADTLLDVRPFAAHALDLLAGREAGGGGHLHPRGAGDDARNPCARVGRAAGDSAGVRGRRDAARDLEGIAPEPVERIEVLKDAAAMGLYGPDAAAGVEAGWSGDWRGHARAGGRLHIHGRTCLERFRLPEGDRRASGIPGLEPLATDGLRP